LPNVPPSAVALGLKAPPPKLVIADPTRNLPPYVPPKPPAPLKTVTLTFSDFTSYVSPEDGGESGRREVPIGKTNRGAGSTLQTLVPRAVMGMALALLHRHSRIASGILCVSSGLHKIRSRNRRLGPCLILVRSLQRLGSGSSHSSASFWPLL
jgi:hypothetical protein